MAIMDTGVHCRLASVVVTLLVIVTAFSNTVGAQFIRPSLNPLKPILPGSLPSFNLPRVEGQSCSGGTNPPQQCLPGLYCDQGGLIGGGTCQPYCYSAGRSCKGPTQSRGCCPGLKCQSGRCVSAIPIGPVIPVPVTPRQLGQQCTPNRFRPIGNCAVGLICTQTAALKAISASHHQHQRRHRRQRARPTVLLQPRLQIKI